MIADRFPQESRQFSFNPKSRTSDGRRSLDSVDYAVWALRMKGAWSRRASFGGHRRCRKHEGEEEIKLFAEEEEEDSGTPSPPLWKGGSPRRFHSQPHIDEQVAGETPRAQEIARYRQELLAQLRGVAEADYELSLRDMVESPPTPSSENREREITGQQSMGKKSGKGRRGIRRSESGRFLLKMLSFPISVGEGKMREGGKAPAPLRSKVSAEKGYIGEDRGCGGRRRMSELGGIGSSTSSSTSRSSSSGSSSSSISSKSSGSNNRNIIKRMSSCYSFFGKNRERDGHLKAQNSGI